MRMDTISGKKLCIIELGYFLQCEKCEILQKSQARDLFLQKIGHAFDRGVMYELQYIVCINLIKNMY